MKNNIIAISGLKASGKNESANIVRYLCNSPKILHNYFFYKLFNKYFTKKYSITSFAHPLKRTLAALLDIDISRFEDRTFKETYYIYFPTLEITNKPNISKIISEGKFSRMVNNKDLSFLKTNFIHSVPITSSIWYRMYERSIWRSIMGFSYFKTEKEFNYI